MSMAKRNTGIYVDEEVLDKNDKIRKAIKEADEFGRDIERSELIERLLREWNEEHEYYLEQGGSGNGRKLLA